MSHRAQDESPLSTQRSVAAPIALANYFSADPDSHRTDTAPHENSASSAQPHTPDPEHGSLPPAAAPSAQRTAAGSNIDARQTDPATAPGLPNPDEDDTAAPFPAFAPLTAGFTSGTTGKAVPVTHGGRTYVVRTGDTLLSIAAKHGVSAPAVIELNPGARSNSLRPGSVLSLPQKPAPARPAGHTVRKGETLASISQLHHVSPQQIRRANSMGDSSLIVVGEVLALQGSGATSCRHKPETPADLPLLPVSFEGVDYPAAVLHAARVNKHLLLLRPAPSVRWAARTVVRLAGEVGVDAALAYAVAQAESGLIHRTVSPVNALGIMQVTPAAGQWACALTGRQLNVLDPADNIVAGLAILRHLQSVCSEESEIAAAYYQGARNVAEHGMAPDTVRFVRTVEAIADRRRRSGSARRLPDAARTSDRRQINVAKPAAPAAAREVASTPRTRATAHPSPESPATSSSPTGPDAAGRRGRSW